MTDYVKSTNFASKDSLPTGNPSKIVKGTEIDTEFNNIATAVATKADLNSPTLIGTPAAPTPAVGTDSTQIATTAYVIDQIANDAPKKDGTGATGSWNINAATASAASGGQFATQQTVGEGQMIVRFTGKNDAYLYNNATSWGLYSVTGGAVVFVDQGTGAATFNGSATSATTATNATNILGNSSQSWTNVSGSRTSGTTYTNSTGKPICLRVSLSGTESVQATATVNGASGIPLVRSYSRFDSPAYGVGEIVVPIGATYSFSIVSGSLSAVWELR
jgi:hypothetical protein